MKTGATGPSENGNVDECGTTERKIQTVTTDAKNVSKRLLAGTFRLHRIRDSSQNIPLIRSRNPLV